MSVNMWVFCPNCGTLAMNLIEHQKRCLKWMGFVPYHELEMEGSIEDPAGIPSVARLKTIGGFYAQDARGAAEFGGKWWETWNQQNSCEPYLISMNGGTLLVKILDGELWKNFYVTGFMEPHYDADHDPPLYWKEDLLFRE